MRRAIFMAVAVLLGCDGGNTRNDTGVDATATVADATSSDARPDADSDIGIDGGDSPARLAVTPTHASLQSIAGRWTSLYVIVENTGGAPTAPLLMSMSGPDADKFRFMRDNCPGGLDPGRRCTVFVDFEDPEAFPDPVFGLQESATLTVVDPGSAGSQVTVYIEVVVLVASRGLAILGPPDMGTVEMGSAGPSLPFIVANTGTGESGPLRVSLSSPQFVKTDDACSGSSLAVAATCPFAAQFVPASPGAAWAILSVESARLDMVASEIIYGICIGP
jgi:hypothetical protein